MPIAGTGAETTAGATSEDGTYDMAGEEEMHSAHRLAAPSESTTAAVEQPLETQPAAA